MQNCLALQSNQTEINLRPHDRHCAHRIPFFYKNLIQMQQKNKEYCNMKKEIILLIINKRGENPSERNHRAMLRN